MSHNTEASSSNPPSSSKKKTAFEFMDKNVDSLINEGCKRLREQVESNKNLNILAFYSRLIAAAFDAINATINKLKPEILFPTVEDAGLLSVEPFAYEYYFMKASHNFKDIRTMIWNSILTGSPIRNTDGGSKKVLMWKKQCYKNIEKIEWLIEDNFLRDFHTWFDGFVLYGATNAVGCLLICLYGLMKLTELEDNENFVIKAENICGHYESFCRNLIFLRLGKVVERVKEQNKSIEELHLKGLEEQNALRKQQSIDEMLVIIQGDIRDKDNRDAECLNKLQEVEAVVKIQEVDFQKKVQVLQAQKKLQEEETKEKLQAEESLRNLQGEEASMKLHEEDTKKILQEEEARIESLEEESLLKELQEEETQKINKKQKSTGKSKKKKKKQQH